MTTITLIGTLGADPELKFTASGVAYLSFNVATNKRVKTDTGWEDGPTSWRRVTAWRGLAEGLTEQLFKGKRVIVVGEEQVRQYETANGDKGISVEVTAEHVGLYLFPKKQGGGASPVTSDTPQDAISGDFTTGGYSDATGDGFGLAGAQGGGDGYGDSYGDSTPF